jgi:3-hydroxyisobutyrate dehydrogenase-like beta-hydroxyacid dehydrogenase
VADQQDHRQPHRKTVGFVGLGDQGEPIAQRILEAGYPMIVYAKRAAQSDRFRANGAAVAGSLAELGAASEILGICVGNDDQVREVANQVLPSMKSGSILVIHSTVQPATCIEANKVAARYNVAVLDAPVSGGRVKAFEGRLVVMVGGDSATFETARSVFDTFSGLVRLVGPLGSGQVLKLVNNYLFIAQLDVISEAIKMLDRLQVAVPTAMEVIDASTGGSRAISWFIEKGCHEIFPAHIKGKKHALEATAEGIRIFRSVLGTDHLSSRLDSLVTAALADARSKL